MAALSSILLVAAFALAVAIGPQTRDWTWGPALLALAAAALAGLPEFWRRGRGRADFPLLALAGLTAGWFAWRAWQSPVRELAESDLLLLAAAVGTFVAVRAVESNAAARRILVWGIAALLLANVGVIARQVFDPGFTPVFGSRITALPTGFFGHYNDAANFLIASSLLLAGAALFGNAGGRTRAVWALVAAAGLVAVYFTRSRGGILGAAVGGAVFAVAALTAGKRMNAKWFTPGVIAVPLVAILLGGFLLVGWKNAQEVRNQGELSGIFENTSRLYLLGTAVSCIAQHPVGGGGSGSFGWECYRFLDRSLQGDMLTRNPGHVHNELLEAATDYGLAGAGLLLALLATLAIVAMVHVAFAEKREPSAAADAWRIGGLAALAGMGTQASFSFVFHLLPGAMLLGLAMAWLSRAAPGERAPAQTAGVRVLLTAAAAACAALLLPFGWKGLRVTKTLWATYFAAIPIPAEARIDAYTAALAIWPQADFYEARAAILQRGAASGSGNVEKRDALLAISDYEMVEKLNPFKPGPVVNRANLLSWLERDAEAESAYAKAESLQGGMEPGFRAHFFHAAHLRRKAARQFHPEEPGPALESMEAAAREMETAIEEMHWPSREMTKERIDTWESLGAAREANGDYPGALEAYAFAVALDGGEGVNFRAGALYRKMGDRAWAAREPGVAMGYFIEAKRLMLRAKAWPRANVPPSLLIENIDYLDKSLEFLQGAKVEPVPVVPK